MENPQTQDILPIISHQMRTSLTTMKWILKMLIDGDTGELTNEQKTLIQKAYESNERLCALVTDMITIAKSDNPEIPYVYEPVDIVDLIDETVFDFVGESYKKHIEILFLKPDEKPLLVIDKEKIRVVLQNLIENAIKYSVAGDKVFISIENKDDVIYISVKDSGIGIPENEKNQIFQKFFRGTLTHDIPGTGLGLYTVKTIIEHHGGTVSCDSTEGTGTTFTVTLPEKRTI